MNTPKSVKFSIKSSVDTLMKIPVVASELTSYKDLKGNPGTAKKKISCMEEGNIKKPLLLGLNYFLKSQHDSTSSFPSGLGYGFRDDDLITFVGVPLKSSFYSVVSRGPDTLCVPTLCSNGTSGHLLFSLTSWNFSFDQTRRQSVYNDT